MPQSVALIDYGLGNLLSVERAFRHLGASVSVLRKPSELADFQFTVLPGVAAFDDGMSRLRQHGWDKEIYRYVRSGKRLLGTCLGMQLLFDEGHEHGITQGLGLFPGRVIPIPLLASSGQMRVVPHMGWRSIHWNLANTGACSLKASFGGNETPDFYFVHSYFIEVRDRSILAASTGYEGVEIPGVVISNNLWGCQFHPEKSGENGLRLLRHFLQQPNLNG